MPSPSREEIITLKGLQSALHRISEWAQHGCKAGDCRVEKTTGMHMNAVCCCTPERFASKLRYLADQLEQHGKLPWPESYPDNSTLETGLVAGFDVYPSKEGPYVINLLRKDDPVIRQDDDLDEPLGKACSLDNPDCESCQ